MLRTVSIVALCLGIVGACGNAPTTERLVRLDLPSSVNDPITLHTTCIEQIAPTYLRNRFAVYVAPDDGARPTISVAGGYRQSRGTVRFIPDFPFVTGVTYLVLVDALLGGEEAIGDASREVHGKQTYARFTIPHTKRPPPRVERVFPTHDTLPQNALRFYIYFSNPMQRGMAMQYVRLLSANGRADEKAFMSFKQELWSPDGRRLTVLLDPGRIKRGVETNRRLGPALVEGALCRLTVEPGWRDVFGQPLSQRYEQSFRVGPPERRAIEHKHWQVTLPSAESNEPLSVAFDRCMDHALLARMISVCHGDGRQVSGSVKAAQHEHVWQFRSDEPWRAGSYTIVVAPELEDVSGNNLLGALDRRRATVENRIHLVRIAFEVSGHVN